MRFLAAFLFVTTCLLPSASYAVDTPKFVIKLDTRAPTDIFAEGFIALGHNRDLMQFIECAPRQRSDSAYIVTIAEPPELSPIYQEVTTLHQDHTFYLYRIRPTDNFSNLEGSLIFARGALPNGAVRRRLDDYWLATREWTSVTWLATTAITGSQIMGAHPVRMENGVLRFGRYVPNPNYYYAMPEASHRPMPVRNATVEEAVVAEDPHGAGFIPGAIVPDGCNAQPRRLSATPSTSCLPLKRVSLSSLYSKTIAKMIAADILTGSSSGQLWSVPGHDEL